MISSPRFARPADRLCQQVSHMRKLSLLFLFMFLVFSTPPARACVGKTLFIGITGSPQEQIYAEMISIMVYERTGTSVKVVTYKDQKELYGAARKGDVGVLIDSAERALRLLNRPAQGASRASYEAAKKEYRQGHNLVWLEPFGDKQFYAPVISLETINNLPALPRLINKLGGTVSDQTGARLLKTADAQKDHRKAAREFLKAKKLI